MIGAVLSDATLGAEPPFRMSSATRASCVTGSLPPKSGCPSQCAVGTRRRHYSASSNRTWRSRGVAAWTAGPARGLEQHRASHILSRRFTPRNNPRHPLHCHARRPRIMMLGQMTDRHADVAPRTHTGAGSETSAALRCSGSRRSSFLRPPWSSGRRAAEQHRSTRLVAFGRTAAADDARSDDLRPGNGARTRCA